MRQLDTFLEKGFVSVKGTISQKTMHRPCDLLLSQTRSLKMRKKKRWKGSVPVVRAFENASWHYNRLARKNLVRILLLSFILLPCPANAVSCDEPHRYNCKGTFLYERDEENSYSRPCNNNTIFFLVRLGHQGTAWRQKWLQLW